MERCTASGERGFTLIELLVVMAIIATLMTLVTPQYFRQHAKAQETVLRHNLSTIRQALDQYREDHGENPDSLQALVDRRYLREIPLDPLTGKPWPALPADFAQLAHAAAQEAGFAAFVPDACLINRYAPGTRLSLHQDRDEQDLAAPIVSISLGLPATFLWGGATRGERALRVPLRHGDAVVWGGVDRLRFHGVLPVAPGQHPATGECRINLTLRKAT